MKKLFFMACLTLFTYGKPSEHNERIGIILQHLVPGSSQVKVTLKEKKSVQKQADCLEKIEKSQVVIKAVYPGSLVVMEHGIRHKQRVDDNCFYCVFYMENHHKFVCFPLCGVGY